MLLLYQMVAGKQKHAEKMWSIILLDPLPE